MILSIGEMFCCLVLVNDASGKRKKGDMLLKKIKQQPEKKKESEEKNRQMTLGERFGLWRFRKEPGRFPFGKGTGPILFVKNKPISKER